MEKEMAKAEQRVKVKGGRTHTLAYTDNVIILAEEKQEMNSLLARLKRYLKKKGLEEKNEEERKMMRFRKGRGKRKKID